MLTVFPFIIVLCLLIISFLTLRGLFPRLRRGHRPLAVRIVCGLLALVLTAFMVHGFRSQLRVSPAADRSDALHLPLQSPPVSAETLASGEVDLLVHVIAGTLQEQVFSPVEVREMRLSWPEEQHVLHTLNLRPVGREIQITLRLGKVHAWTRSRNKDAEVRIEVNVSHHISERGGGSGSSVMPISEVFQLFNRDRIDLPRHSYSLIPGGEVDLAAVYIITPIARKDPGRVVSVEALTAERAGEIHEALSRTQYLHSYSGDRGWFALVQWTGPHFFLLVLTAVLGAECFSRRGLGFTLCMTLLMFGLVGMDKTHQAHHQRRAGDKTLTAPEREIARQKSAVSFFFR